MESFSKFIGNFYPRSLIARFTLIICMPMIICQLVAVFIFYDRHIYNITMQTSKIIANQIEFVLAENNNSEISKLTDYSKIFDFKFEQIKSLPERTIRHSERLELSILAEIFQNEIPGFHSYQYDDIQNKIIIYINPRHHNYIKLTIPAKPIINPTSEIFVFWIIGISVMFLIIAMIFARNQIRSVEQLAEAANKFGGGTAGKFPFKPSGALEIKNAGLALIKMQARIEKQIKKKLQMLAIISHDLRTPLTRMLLQLELSEDNAENQMLKNDAESMKHMIDSYLDFARGEEGETFHKVEMNKWLKEFFEKSRFQKATLVQNSEKEIFAEIKPLSFLRALNNIISNAEKYSKKSELRCYSTAHNIYLELEDDGPGIADNEKELVFRDFYRSDKARRIDQYGSVGLGLPIAKEIIIGHKWQIKIENSKKLGGTKVIITMPIA